MEGLMLRYFFCLYLFSLGVLSAENANLKIALNMPVFYQMRIEGDVTTEGKDPKVNFRAFTMDVDFTIIIKNEQEHFPEIILTPTKFAGLLKFNHGSAVFDLAKENLTFNSILADSFPILNSIKLNQPIRIPISDNTEFLRDAHQNYPILPIYNPEGYAKLARKLLDVIANGLEVKEGRTKAEIPELGLEIFSNEKGLDDQFKGEYIVRFLKPLSNPKSNCAESLMGGGKIKNSAVANNILNTTAQGIFIVIFQKMNCPNKELNGRYEFRGKIALTPKVQAVSQLTRF